jgi:hypothetical protein
MRPGCWSTQQSMKLSRSPEVCIFDPEGSSTVDRDQHFGVFLNSRLTQRD